MLDLNIIHAEALPIYFTIHNFRDNTYVTMIDEIRQDS